MIGYLSVTDFSMAQTGDHYYGHIEYFHHRENHWEEIDLEYRLNSWQARKLNIKEGKHVYHVGEKTTRFFDREHLIEVAREECHNCDEIGILLDTHRSNRNPAPVLWVREPCEATDGLVELGRRWCDLERACNGCPYWMKPDEASALAVRWDSALKRAVEFSGFEYSMSH